MAKVLLNHGAIVDAPTNYGETPLHWAASSVNSLGQQVDLVEFAEVLIAHGANVNGKTGAGRSYRTPLSYAAESNNLPVARVLITHGADVNAGSKDVNIRRGDAEKKQYLTPLNSIRSVEMADFLVSHGALVNPAQSIPPLISAASRGLTPVVNFFLNQGADPNAVSDSGLTALYAAAGSDYYASTVELLLKSGANPNARFANGQTPLHQASGQGAVQVIKLLLANKADIDAVTNYGQSSLFPALRYSPIKVRKELIELLVEKNANVNVVDEDGETPLHQAVDSGQIELVNLLIAKGGNLNPPCSSKRCAPTLLYFARNSRDLTELLTKLGAPTASAKKP